MFVKKVLVVVSVGMFTPIRNMYENGCWEDGKWGNVYKERLSERPLERRLPATGAPSGGNGNSGGYRCLRSPPIHPEPRAKPSRPAYSQTDRTERNNSRSQTTCIHMFLNTHLLSICEYLLCIIRWVAKFNRFIDEFQWNCLEFMFQFTQVQIKLLITGSDKSCYLFISWIIWIF